MLAETVGAATDAPSFSSSRSMSRSLKKKRLRLRGSRTSSSVGAPFGAGPTKNVSGGCVSSRGRGAAIAVAGGAAAVRRQQVGAAHVGAAGDEQLLGRKPGQHLAAVGGDDDLLLDARGRAPVGGRAVGLEREDHSLLDHDRVLEG